MLEIKNLTVKYANQKPSLQDFSMKAEKGEIISIVGESGSGKSTAIRAAMGILPVTGEILSGEILFKGEDLLKIDRSRWNAIRAKEISMIFQDSNNAFNPVRKIGSVFIEYLRTHSDMAVKEAREKALSMLSEMKLGDCEGIMKSYPFQLSGGMRQRVSIAMAMSFTPEVLFADEPTSALDVTMQARIVKQMMELRDNYQTAIVMVTHNMGVAAYMSDKIIVVKDGQIAEMGTPEQIINNPSNSYTRELISSVPELEAENYGG